MSTAALVIKDLRCEHLSEPVAVETDAPRFAWKLVGDGFDRKQTAYRIVVSNAQGVEVWDSERCISGQTLGVTYQGAPLSPLQDYKWVVEVWDENEVASNAVASNFTTGLMGRRWDANWICVPPSKGAKPPEATLAYRNPFRALNVSNFRKDFDLPAGVKRARLYATALGAYRFFINGQRVGDDYLTPGFTDYNKRLEYQSYDIAELLREGDNAIGALLGEGWYAGFLGLDMKRPGALWGRKPQLSAFMLVDLENGDTVRIETDGSWRHFIGGLIYSDMLKGEKFDARMYPAGWEQTGFDANGWELAGTDVGTDVLIVAAPAQPVRCTLQLKPKSVTRAPDGAWVFDMGQNMVGFCELSFETERDQIVSMMHAEMLDADGNLYLENLRSAVQEDIHVGAKSGRTTYAPSFTFHGFQYVGVYGLNYAPSLDDLTGIVINNDLPETSSFESSNKLLNQLHANILWSQRGNFVSVPMDCPQRDERLGWTADGQVFAPTAAYNMDISAFFTKWLDDIVDEQSEEGAFPDVAPRGNSVNDGAPAWGDAGVILPLLMHDLYADTRLIERMYAPMKKWVEFIRRHNPDYVRVNRNHNNYGDWLAVGQETPNDLVATAYYAWLAKLMSRAAQICNIREDVAYYNALYECIAEAYRDNYVRADGTIGSGSQTSYLLSLHVGLVPDELAQVAVGHLVNNIHDAGDKVQVGFLGVRHICPILTEYGHTELAYKLATAQDYPSWGYSVVNGATTIWERWDGWTKEHGFQVPNMNSFNHYAYGSIGEWMFGWMGGIAVDPEMPGYRHFFLRPTPGGEISFCNTRYGSACGEIASSWKRERDSMAYEFSVPANTSATLELVGDQSTTFTVNGTPANPVLALRHGGSRAIFELGSGQYQVIAA